MIRKKCPQCKKVFLTKNESVKFCSYSCSNKSRTKLVLVICKYCGTEFKAKKQGKYTKQFCNRSCVAKYRQTLPHIIEINKSKEHGKKISISIKKSRLENPEMWKKLDLKHSKRMKRDNPSFHLKNLLKAKETKRINGTLHIWPGNRGGNGQFTIPQKILSVALGWEMEMVIKTGHSPLDKSGFPPNYKVDLGNRDLKIAIEVDGQNHKSKKIILLDIKKTKKLKELGWKVLRFTNEMIIENLSQVLLEIKNEIKGL